MQIDICIDYYTWQITVIIGRKRADSRFAPSQWEMALLCNDVSHWLGTSLEAVLRNITWCYNSIGYDAQDPGNLGPLLQTGINLTPSKNK